MNLDFWLHYAGPLQLVIKGLLIGIIASAPMGPVGVLCIQRTLQKGRAYGLATGAGAALSDILYALMTGFGMGFVMDLIDNERTLFVLKLVGSAMLLVFGLYMFRTDPRRCIRPGPRRRGSLIHNFVTAFLVTLSNPLIVFLFVALFSLLTFVVPDHLPEQCLGYTSIVVGAMLWWFVLTYIIDRMRQSFGLRGILRLNRTIGTVVVVAAVCYALTTLLHLNLF